MAMKIRSGNHAVSGTFVFLLLGVFAVMSTMLIIFSAQAYHATIDRTAENGAERVLTSYIRNVLRASDAEGMVSVEEIDGRSVIVIRDADMEEDYRTWIYAWDGSLCELFSEAEEGFRPDSGDAICPVESMRAELNGSLLTVLLTETDGTETLVRTVLRAGGEAR